MATGITTRHGRGCPSRSGGKCDSPCTPAYEAWVWDKRAAKKIVKRFANVTEAKNWRGDAVPAARKGVLRSPSKLTLRAAADEWLDKIETGVVLSRNRRPYKPSVVRGYRADLENHVLDDLGGLKLAEVTADDLQALIERLSQKTEDRKALSGSKVRNVIVALQALYRYYRRQVMVDPTHDLDLPERGGRREWTGTPQDAKALLDPLPFDVRAVYATAFYAGLRRGELRALRVRNLHGLDGAGEAFIEVEHGWDDYAGEIDPKSSAGARKALMPETLRLILADHVKETGRNGDALVFGRTAFDPFTPTFLTDRADEAWTAAKLDRVTLHQCRHAHASFLDAAGISEARCDRYMGHARHAVSDRYRHQLKGQLAKDAKELDDYLNDRQRDNVVAFPTGAHTGAQPSETASVSQAV